MLNKPINTRLVIYVSAAILLSICLLLQYSPEHWDIPEQSDEPAIPERRITLVFAGDLMQHMPQVEAARTAEGFDYSDCFVHMAPFFLSADIAVANLETTLTDSGHYSGYPTFSSPVQLAFDMYDAGIRYVITTNNHTLDKGIEGVTGTVSALDRARIRHTGVFTDSLRYAQDNPLLIESSGIRFTLLAYTYATNRRTAPDGVKINLIDTLEIKRDIAKADSLHPDFKVVYLHWGDEYQTRESAAQRTLAEWLCDNGIEFVIGSHPHVVQPLYIMRDSLGNYKSSVVYSLGNFISNQSRPNTDGGIVVRYNIIIGENGKLQMDGEYLPVWTYKRIEGGKAKYSIIPSLLADSLLMNDKDAVLRYLKFRANLADIIPVDGGFKEAAALVIDKDKP